MSPAVPGDRELLLRVLAETGARTDMPAPSWTDYLASVLDVLAGWLGSELRPLRTLFNLPREILYVVAWSILALVVVLLGLGLKRLLARRRVAAEHVARAQVQPPTAAVPVAGWAAELESRLSAGRPRAALEALWWWLARSLVGAAAEPSWTTRELLAQARRADLAGQGRTLDRLLYGAAEPDPNDVRTLATGLREALR